MTKILNYVSTLTIKVLVVEGHMIYTAVSIVENMYRNNNSIPILLNTVCVTPAAAENGQVIPC